MPLYLLPNVFDDAQSPLYLLPSGLETVVATLTGLIAERERTGRRYLHKLLPHSSVARDLPVVVLDEHSTRSDYDRLALAIAKGETWGLISDAGMPGIADPGKELVTLLRRRGVTSIRVFPGPSSILLALVSSGFDGQRFAFHGYVPKASPERQKILTMLERESDLKDSTQIFIETPYRNQALFDDCMKVLRPTTELCLACRLTYEDESVQRRTVAQWKLLNGPIRSEPTVFLLHSHGGKPLS